MSTTDASTERRASKFDVLHRREGKTFIQGIDQGRAFSFVIDEASGVLNVAIAKSGSTITVFGACTPWTGKE